MAAGALVAALALMAGVAWVPGSPLLATTETAPAPVSIDPPAPPGSNLPALAVEGPTTFSKEHEVLLTWLEPRGRLRFSRLSRGSWSPPVTIAEQVSAPDPADAPSLTVIETRGVRRTLIARTGDTVSRSGDGGRSWTRLPAPALPFASFAGGEEGAYAFWLGTGEDGAAKLLGTRVLAGETLLDPRVSAGAGTAAAMTWDGPVVVYQGWSAAEAREIAIVRRQEGRWTDPRPIHREDWRPAGTGLHVAAWQRQVAVAWPAQAAQSSQAPGGSRLAVAFSSDAGRTFGAPVEVAATEDGPAPAGPVALVLDGDGQALVLWAAGATLNLARVSPDGRQGPALAVAKAPAVGIPQIVQAGGQVAVAWTEGAHVHAVAVPLAAIPPLRSRPLAQAVAAEKVPAETYTGRGRVGDPVPGFALASLQGEKVSLASLHGQPVLLNLWATWCLPCLREMPDLAALQERFGEKGLVVVGLNVDAADALDKVRTFVAERKIPFTVWLDPGMRVSSALRVQALPASFVIDREGKIVLRRDEAITAGDLELETAIGRALTDL